jgi:hypothetical protein
MGANLGLAHKLRVFEKFRPKREEVAGGWRLEAA